MKINVYDSYCKEKIEIVKKFIKKSDSILDIGCGGPDHKYCLNELIKYPKWMGFDINPVENKRIIQGDILKKDIAANSYDVVLCLDVLEHFKEPEILMKKLIKISKKKVIIITPVTKYKNLRKFTNIIRKIFGIGVLEGHYYEFFDSEMEKMSKGSSITEKIYIPFPLPFVSNILYKTGIVRSGIFVLEKNN
jgi:SAM-dependent methyltransferase